MADPLRRKIVRSWPEEVKPLRLEMHSGRIARADGRESARAWVGICLSRVYWVFVFCTSLTLVFCATPRFATLLVMSGLPPNGTGERAGLARRVVKQLSRGAEI